jgi:hypothetical protein
MVEGNWLVSPVSASCFDDVSLIADLITNYPIPPFAGSSSIDLEDWLSMRVFAVQINYEKSP